MISTQVQGDSLYDICLLVRCLSKLPLSRAVGLNKTDGWGSGEGFCGEDTPLQLDPKSCERIAPQDDLAGFHMKNLPPRADRAGCQRYWRREGGEGEASEINGEVARHTEQERDCGGQTEAARGRKGNGSCHESSSQWSVRSVHARGPKQPPPTWSRWIYDCLACLVTLHLNYFIRYFPGNIISKRTSKYNWINNK